MQWIAAIRVGSHSTAVCTGCQATSSFTHQGDIQDLTSNLDEFTGKSVEVLEDITLGRQGGAVEFKGARWKAVSDLFIGKGEMAVITGVSGITLEVRKQ